MQKAKEIKDIVEKEFLAFPDVAADVINALLYQGNKITNAKKLLSGPTESIYQGEARLRNQYEDLCKYEMSGEKIILMYLIANQSKPDSRMLLRKAGYIGGVYREQYESKTWGIFPVVELVLYWGHPRWRGSRDIRMLFRKQKLPEETWKYIDRLKLHVFEMRYLPPKTRSLFQSDMRIIVDFLAEGNDYRSDRKIIHKAAVIRMIRILSGDTDSQDIEKWLEEQKIQEEDDITVCELFNQYVRQGKAEGENRLARLVQMLIDSGRNEELQRALSDQGYRNQLYTETGLS